MTATPLACHPHDHSHCGAAALAPAGALCARSGARLTALRRRVLELVWRSHQPRGAAAVYRALDFLLENGLIHRIASLNAFIGCNHPGQSHQGHFFLCRQCSTAIEVQQPAIGAAIAAAAGEVGFAVESQMVEVVGLCSRCRVQP